MRRAILASLLLLALPAFAAAAQPTGAAGIQQAMSDLCSSSKSLLGVAAMLFLLLSGLPLLIGAALFHFKKEDKNLKLAGIALLAIGGLLLAAAVLGIIIYLLVPAIIGALVGPDVSVAC